MDSRSTDERWLDAAARLAMPMLGATGPVPAVGALVVDVERQVMFGRAATPPRGGDRPELMALAEAKGLTRGRTLYLTLEPAAQFTTMVPILDRIAGAGIGRVVVGALDPEPGRAGEGLAALGELGVEAIHLPSPACIQLAEGAVTRATKSRPFVTMKVTLSLDGMVGQSKPGADSPLGVEALRFLERQRAAADAVISGAARAEIEDNDLAVHLDGLATRDILRVVLAGARALNTGIDLFARVSGLPLMVVTTTDRPLTLRPGIEVVSVEGRHGRPDLRQVLHLLAARGISRAFVEAGARLAESFVAGELVDRIHVIDTAQPIGRGGTPAALLGRFEDRIAAARFSQVDRRGLGEDKVRTFERT